MYKEVGGWWRRVGTWKWVYLPLGHRQQYYTVSDRRVPGISWGKVKLDPCEKNFLVNRVIQGNLYLFSNRHSPQDRPRL